MTRSLNIFSVTLNPFSYFLLFNFWYWCQRSFNHGSYCFRLPFTSPGTVNVSSSFLANGCQDWNWVHSRTLSTILIVYMSLQQTQVNNTGGTYPTKLDCLYLVGWWCSCPYKANPLERTPIPIFSHKILFPLNLKEIMRKVCSFL